MADLFKNIQGILGGAKASIASAIPSADSDFADFATAASPVVPGHAATSSFAAAAATGGPKAFAGFSGLAGRPYTAWWRIWERTTLEDFYQELFIIPLILTIVFVNLWGAAQNRKRAREWALAYFPLLESEYASVGYDPRARSQTSLDDFKTHGLAAKIAETGKVSQELLKEKSKSELTTYATGRQNVAWLDVKVTLLKRHNPFLLLGETVLSAVSDLAAAPAERLEATAYCFDGKEKSILAPGHSAQPASKDSTFDGFVWAIVHKDKMKQLRQDRYDLSLTTTKDHPKLPIWATIMSESAQVTDALLTPELIKAVHDSGEDLEALIVSDQPIDAPQKIDDLVSKKRVSLSMRLSTDASSVALFAYFLRLPDLLVTTAHFRPEALRKIKATREDEARKLRKLDEDEKAEERRLAGDKLKKEERERKLSKMSAAEQKKFLEKEAEKQQKRQQKKQSVRA